MRHDAPKPTDLQIAESICRILGELYRLTALGLDARRIDRVRREAIFFLYEGGEPAKWQESRPHSSAARQLRSQVTRAEFQKAITYDHAVPLATLWDGLRDSACEPTKMLDFLQRHVIGVVLLRTENDKLNQVGLRSRMPDRSVAHDRMARYRTAGIAFEPDDSAALGGC